MWYKYIVLSGFIFFIILSITQWVKEKRKRREFEKKYSFDTIVFRSHNHLTNQDIDNLIKSVKMTFGNIIAAGDLINKLENLKK